MAGGMEPDGLQGPFQRKTFYDSMDYQTGKTWGKAHTPTFLFTLTKLVLTGF